MFKIDLLKKRKTNAVVDKHFSSDTVESNKRKLCNTSPLNSMHTVGPTQLVGYNPDQKVQTNIVFF